MARKNYSKMSTTPSVDTETESKIDEVVSEEPAIETEVEAETVIEPVIGHVSGCGKLNIRNKPNTSGDVLYEAVLKSELVIDLDKSTTDWYYVCTPAGVEGYCMKKFVTLK